MEERGNDEKKRINWFNWFALMRNQNKLIETNKGFGFHLSHFAFEMEVFEPNA